MGTEPLNLPAPLQCELDRIGLRFLADILAIETARHPQNIDALAELGHVYTRLGLVDRGLEVDRQLVRLVPANPTVHYNLACSLALSNYKCEAIDSLERAVELGYSDPEFIQRDDDLDNLRTEPRFQAIVQRLRMQSAKS